MRSATGAAAARQLDEPGDDDQDLVAAVRRGDDRAFEVLYGRYQRRIHAYVFGMVKDHGRAEDVTQEVFVSALRRMRETEQPLAFRPWLYQIAKNGCIDAFRRARRGQEVSYDAQDALAPGDHAKLVGTAPSPEAAVAVKQDLENLRGAFVGLSDTHHEILVMRELEGLTYTEIGRRLDMSRSAVESTLFRARRRLTEEYDDIVSGARCLRTMELIGAAAEATPGLRDTRRLARHLSHCQPCRRAALAAGLDRELLTRPSVRERLAGLLPMPAWVRLRRGGGADAAASPEPGRWSAHLPLLSDHLSSGWGRAATGAAVLVAGLGGAAGVRQATSAAPEPARERPAAQVAAVDPDGSPTATPTAASVRAVADARRDPGAATGRRGEEAEPATRRSSALPRRSGASTPAPAGTVTPQGGGRPTSPAAAGTPTRTDAAADTPAGDREPAPASSPAPSGKTGGRAPSGGGAQPVAPVATTVAGAVQQTGAAVQQAAGAVQQATQQTTQAVDDTVQAATGGGPVADAVDDVTDAVDDTVDQAAGAVGDTVDGAAGAVGDTVGGLTGGLGGGGG